MGVGLSVKRYGDFEKALGRAKYGADLKEERDLFLVCVRSNQAPAKIKAIDVEKASKVPGVAAIFTAKDIPGEKRLGIAPSIKDQEFLAEDLIRHMGQAVALVAGDTESAARKAAELVYIKADTIPGVFDPINALEPNAPLVHPDRQDTNIMASRIISKGDLEEGFSNAAIVHEAEYSTSWIEHSAMETEAGRAWLEDGRVVIRVCTQNPHYDRGEVARFLGIKESWVRIIQAETGGGFGGKLDVSVQPYLGLVAWLLKRPVRMVYNREETFLGTGKRHPLRIKCRSGADSQGKLTAWEMEIIGDTGAFASYGLAVATRAAVHGTGPYYVPNVHVDCKLVYTNNPWAGAMRGFGVPQVALAHEGQMDGLADKLGMDRLEFRLINCLCPGRSTATGQVLESSVGMARCLEALKPTYHKWRSSLIRNKNVVQGVGLGAMFYGIGNTGVPNPSTAQIQWTQEGDVILFTGAAEIGQGSDTILRQMVASGFNIDEDRISLVRGDTDLTTDAGATSASRQTYISGRAVMEAVRALEDMIFSECETLMEVDRLDLEMAQGKIWVKGSPDTAMEVERVIESMNEKGIIAKGFGEFNPDTTALDPETGQGSPYGTYAFAAHAALVEVNPWSGETVVKKVAAAHDVGRAINPLNVEGQICGGVLMGLGMTLMEEYIPGETGNFENYLIPTLEDTPEIDPIIIVEEEESTGPFGAKGVGEPALIPTIPTIASAVGQAVGAHMRDLPISLERIMEALNGAKNED